VNKSSKLLTLPYAFKNILRFKARKYVGDFKSDRNDGLK
tara:strand:- start:10248 stop:10364 length:117 start_codon:yes stop_codon:yes gene_type:complete